MEEDRGHVLEPDAPAADGEVVAVGFEGGDIGEGGSFGDEAVEEGAAGRGVHGGDDEVGAEALEFGSGFLSLADVFAVGGIVGHFSQSSHARKQ